MEFHLVYAGDPLKAAGSGRTGKRVWEKHAIRKYLHPQLKRLWKTHPALSTYAARTVEIDDHNNRLNPPKPWLEFVAHNYERSGTGFIPLITEPNGLACSLDILFLRPDKPGSITDSRGDLDNRIKVLLDALRIPRDGSEMLSATDDPMPNPTYCLLQDDSLVTTLRVKTDTLLFSAGAQDSEACLVIRVETFNVDPFGSPWELHL